MNSADYFESTTLQLADAIVQGDIAALRKAISSGVEFDRPGREGVTLLMFALVRRGMPIVELLLKAGADPNRRAANGENAVTLATALAPDNLEFLRSVLRAGGDANTRKPNGDPILVTLIAQANIDGIKVAVEEGADTHIPDRTGTPAILAAGLMDHWDCVDVLIGLGADWRTVHEGLTLAWLASTSAIKNDSPIYPHLARMITRLRQAGVAFPPKSPGEILAEGGG